MLHCTQFETAPKKKTQAPASERRTSENAVDASRMFAPRQTQYEIERKRCACNRLRTNWHACVVRILRDTAVVVANSDCDAARDKVKSL